MPSLITGGWDTMGILTSGKHAMMGFGTIGGFLLDVTDVTAATFSPKNG